MREILFRGKRIDGAWEYGYYFAKPILERHFIILGENQWAVEAKTLGQFTGLTDKNGKKIFEGDIVKTHFINTKKNDFVEQVVFHNGRFCSMFKVSENARMVSGLPDGVPHLPNDKTPYMDWCEVIGNIHDNPELLEGGAEDGK